MSELIDIAHAMARWASRLLFSTEGTGSKAAPHIAGQVSSISNTLETI